MPNNWLFQQLQKWTPFSVSVIIISAMAVFVVVWCTVNNQPVPVWDTTMLGVFGTIMGATGLVNHGVTIANGVAKSTATATVKAVTDNMTVSNTVTAPLPTVQPVENQATMPVPTVNGKGQG